MKNIFLIIALIASNISFAGGREVGNGGNSVVCRTATGQIKTVELLDYYEAKNTRGLEISLGSDKMNLHERLQIAVYRLEKFSPLRALKMSQDIKTFFDNTFFVKNQRLTPISDSGHIILPSDDCQVEQTAIQKKLEFSEDKLFYINKEIWASMSSLDQAGLVLHELLLKESLDYGHTDSISARYFNSILSGPNFENYTFKDFIKLLNRAEFNKTDIGGFSFEIEDCKTDQTLEMISFYPKVARLEACPSRQPIKKLYPNNMFFSEGGRLIQINFNYFSWFLNNKNEKLTCSGRNHKAGNMSDYISFDQNNIILSSSCQIQLLKQ